MARALLLGSFCLSAAIAQPPAGLLLVRGAAIHTGTTSEWVGDLIVRDGRYAPTSTAEIDPRAVVFDLPGALVVPGLIDAHGHLLALGGSLVEVDLRSARSFAEVVARAAAAAAALPPGSWVLGRGWDQNNWPEQAMPHHEMLSAATPDHPVWLVRVDGHAGLANARALQVAGITRASEAPPGGEICRDGNGEPTGLLVDAAMASIRLPELTPAERRRRLLLAQAECLRHGLTCVHDAGVDRDTLEAMVALHADGQWLLRTYVLLAAGERELIARGPWQTADGLIVVRAVKAYADGALGSRGAVLLEPYADRPGWRGLMLGSRERIRELAQACADAGMQLCTHAIGDAANRSVLDAYAAVEVEGGLAARRFRIEHAQIVADDDVARFRALGVLPSMQPTHLTSDMPWAVARLGSERIPRAYAWRRFHELGVAVPFGSDFPVESVDPLAGIYAAVTTRGGANGVELRPDQKLSREDALRGFTAHAAVAMFAEQQLGTIERGRSADFVVFDRNLLACPEAQILTAKVLLTVVAGRVVYDGRTR